MIKKDQSASESAKKALDNFFKQKYQPEPKMCWFQKIINWFFK